MEATNSGVDMEIDPSKRCYRKDMNDADRISNLPDSILEYIVSFLPTQDAVRTVVISRRFKRTWLFLHRLDFNYMVFDRSAEKVMFDESDYLKSKMRISLRKKFNSSWFKFSGIVDAVLKLHRRQTLEKFNLDLSVDPMLLTQYISCGANNASKDVNRWLAFAVSKETKVIDLSCALFTSYQGSVIPSCVWSCNSLVELHLSHCKIQLKGGVVVRLEALKELSLVEVKVDDTTFKVIVNGCPRIEYVNIEGPCSDKLCIVAPSVSRLRLVSRGSDDQFKIECPNLMSFEFTGRSDGLLLNSLHLPTLRYAALDVELKTFDEFREFMMKFRLVEILKLGQTFAAMFAYAAMSDLACVRNLCWKVAIDMPGRFIGGVIPMLSTSPCLQELRIDLCSQLIRLPEDTPELDYIHFYHFGTFVADGVDCRNHLKTVTICFSDKRYCYDARKLASFFLKNATALDEFVVLAKDRPSNGKAQLTVQDLFDFSQSLLRIPRTSKSARVLLSQRLTY